MATQHPQNTTRTAQHNPWRFCIAPMMDWSTRHCRFFWRLLSKEARLYTEMVTTGALLQGDAPRFLKFSTQEHPIALQVGGSDPKALAQCAKLAEDWGYDEINLNCGCPSDRVQNGKIGAILMKDAALVAECVAAMRNNCDIPVTVKHRIGVDDQEDFASLTHFVNTVAESGCTTFIVHARKAWLNGLSPKENREVPPLNYDCVKQLKHAHPHLTIVINGGITDIETSDNLLRTLDGVMLGRAAYQNPYMLADVDQRLFRRSDAIMSREAIINTFADYCEKEIQEGTRLHHMSRHILGLFLGQPGARAFRRFITEHVHNDNASADILRQAVQNMRP